MKICELCLCEFHVNDHSKPNKFCSVECYRKFRVKNSKLVIDTHINSLQKCTVCESDFIPKTIASKFCSKKCQNRFHYLSKVSSVVSTCIQCKLEYHPCNKTSTFCSKQCYWTYRNENSDVIFQSNQEKTQLTNNTCKYCRKDFAVWNYRKQTASFCSIKCHKDYGTDFIKCPTCKKIFNAQKNTQRKYCSLVCANKGVDKRKSKFSVATHNILNKLGIEKIESEVFIRLPNASYTVDFMLNDKIIIECYGDYWHCNPTKYDGTYFHKQIRKLASEIWEYDENRIDRLTNAGYFSIIIWETEWRRNPNFPDLLASKLKDIEHELHKS